MKKFLFGLMLAAMPVLAWSSTVENGYHSMFSEGKVWNYTYHAQGGDQKMYIEVKGDTMINNQSCYKLYLCTSVSRQIYGYFYEKNGSVNAYLMQDWRKEGGKWNIGQKNGMEDAKGVYHFMPSDYTWNYSNNADATARSMSRIATERAPAYGKRYPEEIPYPVAVNRYELVQVGGAVFARAFLTDVQKHDTLETWASGVGDRYWGIMNPVPAERQPGDEWIEFESCYEQGQCLFTKKDFDKEALSAPYRPFVENGKKWTCKTNTYGADIYYYYLQGDTIVDNKPCLKLFSQNRYNNGATCYEGALFEEDRQVFLYRGGSSKSSLLYDFSLEQGQIAVLYQSESSSWYDGVERITDAFEMIDGQMFHITVFYELFNDKRNELTYDSRMGAWIEGVGPTNKMDVIDNYGFNLIGGNYGWGIIDCSVNGKSFYRADNYEELMPQEQPRITVDGAIYRILSAEDKTAECCNILKNIEELNVRDVVTIEGEQYTVTAIADDTAPVGWGANIRTLNLPSTIKRIGHSAFVDCESLTSLKLPDGLEYIGNYAFSGGAYKEIYIPASVSHIGNVAFSGEELTSLMVDKDNAVYDSREDCNAVIETASNLLLLGCQTTVVPTSVTAIGPGAFSYCYGLKSIDLPEGVKSVGWSAFGGCYNMDSITVHSPVPPQADKDIIQEGSYKTVVLSVPKGASAVYHETPIWGKFTNIVELPAQGNDTENDDYLPFVELGKMWHVVRSDCNSDRPIVHYENYMLYEGVVKEGKTYLKMYRSEDLLDVVYDMGLFREENRKVYIYDADRQKEHLMFDYSLKVGDTYVTYSVDEQKMVTYKVLSVGDYTEGPQVTLNYYDEKGDSTVSQNRYLRKWVVCRTDNEAIQKTWIEGIGSLEGPLANRRDIVLPSTTLDYLAYVEYGENDYTYLPFSFYDKYGQIHGCNLPKGKAGNWDYRKDGMHHQLTYELEGDRLHVYGNVLLMCGLKYYAYFREEQTDDPLVHKLSFDMHGAGGEPMNCDNLYATNFYVPGFNPNMSYIVVDDFGEEHPVINKTPQMAYRPMIEEGKVWKVGAEGSGNPVQWVEYYYFDGDTIVDGKTCKQMMSQRYVNPDFAESNSISQDYSVSYVGAWYEENQKVYKYDSIGRQFNLMYDFAANANDTIQINSQPYVIGSKQTGGIKGFKGIYRAVFPCSDEGSNRSDIWFDRWLEGVGGLFGPTINVFDYELADPMWFLMSCTVGDEVIYFNDAWEDGATPEAMEARKHFDFTHTIKEQPKAPQRREAEQPLYGEYNDLQLGIHLDPLDEAYLVRIADETGKAVYEKAINAGSIMGLNIDISAYTKGRYTVTVENSRETFTGEFETEATGVVEVKNKRPEASNGIYNLQGQRLTGKPSKGVYIENGRKKIK